MDISRRGLMTSLAGAAALAPIAASAQGGPAVGQISLPDRTNFQIDHTYLNAAYVHPMGRMTYDATEAFLQSRINQVDRAWPGDNPRNKAVEAFARLINADPKDIAVVPSTMVGENMVADALGLNEHTKIVTDAYHYSPEIYGELHRRGVPLAVATPTNNRIELADIDRLIDKTTRLVAVSAVSSDTGYRHDIKALSEMAHRKGALVYADIIQAAGAVPIDVKDSGVDFCCSGAYKWLMGDFGVAFLYVRPDRLLELQRLQAGWRQVQSRVSHVYPFDTPGQAGLDYVMRDDAVGKFEVSTPAWAALAGLVASIGYVQSIGVDRIMRHRAPLMARLQAELPKRGFIPLTPADRDSPTVAFAYQDAAAKLGPALTAARVKITVQPNRIRISPSVYNDMSDVERLLQALATVT